MRTELAALLFSLATLGATAAANANEPAPGGNPPRPLLPLTLTATVEDCLKQTEQVVDQAEDTDLLDDQSDEVDTLLERMEEACNKQQFAEALEAGQAVHKILATNK